MKGLKFIYTFLNLSISSDTFFSFLLNESLEFILKFILIIIYFIVKLFDVLGILVYLSFNSINFCL